MDNLTWLILGAGIGYVTGQLLLVFFSEEIFNGIDAAANKVRKFFGLRS